MYTHIKGVDSTSSSMSLSVMTSISERDEHRTPLDDDCPDYEAVVNRRHESFLINFRVLTPFKQLECTLPKLP